MNKMKFVVKVAVLIIGSNAMLPIFALSHNDYGKDYLSNISQVVNADSINMSKDNKAQRIDEFVDNPTKKIDMKKMDEQELQFFESIAQVEAEKANLPTKEDTEVFKQALLDLYNSDSENYQNLVGSTEQIIEDINENHESVFDKVSGEKVLAAAHGTISVKVLAGAINLALTFSLGVGVGAGIKALVIKVGAKKAANSISKTVVATLLTFGIKKVTGIDTIISIIVKKILDPGDF